MDNHSPNTATIKNKRRQSQPLTMAKLLTNTAKHAINPKNYTLNNLQTQWQRSKRVTGMIGALCHGISYAYAISHNNEITQPQIIQYIQKFCQKICYPLDLEVIAIEPIPQHHALWVSNHISWLDIPTIGSIIPTFFLSKDEIAHWPLIGWLARTANTLFIKRGSGDADSVSKQMATFLAEGSSVIFFPEATTTDGTNIKRIHGKLLQSAIDTNLPIQPIVICYVNKQGKLDTAIPYYGDISFLDSVKQVLDNYPAKAYVLPLEPIMPTGKNKSELTEILQQQMINGLQRLHQQVLVN